MTDYSLRDERFAALALLAADRSSMKYHQHGCIAVLGGQIIARGWNSYRCYSNDGYLNNACSCHAEIDVLRKLRKLKRFLNKRNSSQRIPDSTFYSRISLYVARKNKMGDKYKDSSPCAYCAHMMKSLNIRYIIYSNSTGTLTKCRVTDYDTTHNSQGNLFLLGEKEKEKENEINEEKEND